MSESPADKVNLLGLDATRSRQTLPVAKTDQDNLDAAENLPGSFAATSLAGVVSEGRKLAVLSLDGGSRRPPMSRAAPTSTSGPSTW